jgi:hypothetical protein
LTVKRCWLEGALRCRWKAGVNVDAEPGSKGIEARAEWEGTGYFGGGQTKTGTLRPLMVDLIERE